MSKLNIYIPIADFISQFLGPDTEIILYDTAEDKIVHLCNQFNPNTKIGDRVKELEHSFIDQDLHLTNDSIINYRNFTYDKKKLRSATHFIKDEDGDMVGMFIINYKVDGLLDMREKLNDLISGHFTNYKKEEKIFYETHTLSFDDMMTSTIQDALKKFNAPPDRLSYEEKMELIKMLDDKGTFLIKGSVPELAKILKTTETTVYRYIHKL